MATSLTDRTASSGNRFLGRVRDEKAIVVRRVDHPCAKKPFAQEIHQRRPIFSADQDERKMLDLVRLNLVAWAMRDTAL